MLADHAGQLAAPVPVIVETAWLLLDRAGPAAQAGYLRLITSGQLAVVDLDTADWARVGQLVEAYANLARDVIDASVIAAV